VPEEENAVAKTGRTFGWRGAVAVVILVAAGRASAHAQAPGTVGTPTALNNTRVRADDPALSALIRQATDQSATFRSLVEAIQSTDGIVYVIRGRCGNYDVHACLMLWMAVAGPNRMLRVIVDDRSRSDVDTMASIGHELRHALEVLTESNATTGAGMFNFYRHSGGVQGVFETEAAIATGEAVYLELKRHLAN
jgi:hypothetical protein